MVLSLGCSSAFEKLFADLFVFNCTNLASKTHLSILVDALTFGLTDFLIDLCCSVAPAAIQLCCWIVKSDDSILVLQGTKIEIRHVQLLAVKLCVLVRICILYRRLLLDPVWLWPSLIFNSRLAEIFNGLFFFDCFQLGSKLLALSGVFILLS